MLFKNLDIYLASNKPEIWISKIHKLTAYFLIALVIEIILGILLPISIDTLPVMLIASAVSIAVIIYWFRNQIKSFDKNLIPSELLKVFLFNIAGFIMLSLLIFTIPLIISLRINRILNNSDYKNDIIVLATATISDTLALKIRSGEFIGEELLKRLMKDSLTMNDSIYFFEKKFMLYDFKNRTSDMDFLNIPMHKTTRIGKNNNEPFDYLPNYIDTNLIVNIIRIIKSPQYKYDSIERLAFLILDKYDLSRSDNYIDRDGFVHYGYSVGRQLENIRTNRWVWDLSDRSSLHDSFMRYDLILLFLFFFPILSFILLIDNNSWRVMIVFVVFITFFYTLNFSIGIVDELFSTTIKADDKMYLEENSLYLSRRSLPGFYFGFVVLILILTLFFHYKLKSRNLYIIFFQLLNYLLASLPFLTIFFMETILGYYSGSFFNYLIIPAFLLMLVINFQFIKRYRNYMHAPQA